MNSLCAYCRKNPAADRSTPEGAKVWPFCSARCKTADLGAWAKGTYAIPAVESDEDDSGEFQEGDSPAKDYSDSDDQNSDEEDSQ